VGGLIENVLKQNALKAANYFDPICKQKKDEISQKSHIIWFTI